MKLFVGQQIKVAVPGGYDLAIVTGFDGKRLISVRVEGDGKTHLIRRDWVYDIYSSVRPAIDTANLVAIKTAGGKRAKSSR